MKQHLRVYFEIFFGYFLLFPNFIFIEYWTYLGPIKFLYLFILCIWNGFVFHYLTLFIHAAAHFNIHPNNRRLNDIVANFLLGYYFLMPIKTYRKKHFKHHKYIGTSKDPENSYKYNLSFSNFLKWFFFYFAIKKLWFMFYQKNRNFRNLDSEILFSIIIFSLIHFLFLGYSYYNYTFEFYFCLLFIPQIMILPVLNWLRTSAEHAPFETSKESFSLRNFGNDKFLSIIFGAAGFKYHDIHHLNPGIHYLDLPKYKDEYKLKIGLNYSKVIKKLYLKTKFN